MPENSVPRAAVVSCHLERPLDDECWRRFEAVARRHDVIALIRPPDPAFGEDEAAWLERARTLRALGLHTHWTSPSHARPTGGDPAERVRREAAWMRERGLEPRWFCGGGWYTDDAVRGAVAELGLVDCTPRYVHAYFHDYDLLDSRRRAILVVSLQVLRLRRASLR